MLSGKRVLITGASSGIGKSTAIIFAKEGASVCGVGRNEDSLKEMMKEGVLVNYIVADLNDEGACEKIVKAGVEKLGGELTTLVNVRVFILNLCNDCNDYYIFTSGCRCTCRRRYSRCRVE